MNFTQYIAICTILDHEIETNKENTVLPQVITILLDKGDELNEEDYAKVEEAINTVSISAAGGVTGATLASIFGCLLAGIPHQPRYLASPVSHLVLLVLSEVQMAGPLQVHGLTKY